VNVHQQLRIDTPEQIALELPIAGVGSRFLAMAVDTLLQAVLYLAIGILIGLFGLQRTGWFDAVPAGALSFVSAILLLALFAVYWGYFVAFEWAWRGQTPGKRVAGLRVIRDSGRPVDVTAVMIRNLLRAIDVLPVFYGVGILCMLLNQQSKRLGDFAAGTLVIHDRAPAALDGAWSGRTPAASMAPRASAPSRLTEAEVAVIEAFLHRRGDLDWTARDNTAERLAARIRVRLDLRPEPGQTLEEFLEALARAARDGARYR
jgi:uncharacterized RDD family membrane protein YckC